MDPLSILNKISEYLAETKLFSQLDRSAALLYVDFGNDELNRERLLEITSKSLSPDPRLSQFKELSNFDIFLTEFRYLFPFPFETLATNQLGNLLHFLNYLSDFPGYQMDEIENRIVFRYILSHSESPSKETVLTIIGKIFISILLFSEAIELVASGQKTFNDLLELLIEQAKKI